MASTMPGEKNGSGEGPDHSFRNGDPRFIDCENPCEYAYWCKALGVSEAELCAAVAAVGNSAQWVRDWLAAKRQQAQ